MCHFFIKAIVFFDFGSFESCESFEQWLSHLINSVKCLQHYQQLKHCSTLFQTFKFSILVTNEAVDDIITKTISLDTDIAPHNIERSHHISQSRQPGEKPRPIIVNLI